MTSHANQSPARAALSRLPGWVTALGMALVLAELTADAVVLAGGWGGLAVLGGETRTVVLQVGNVYGDDSATYTTPTRDGRFDVPAEARPLGQGSYSEPGANPTKTVAVRPGGIVTIHTFSGTGAAVTCSITVDGKVLSLTTPEADPVWTSGTCRARIP